MFENVFKKYMTVKNAIFLLMVILFLILIVKMKDIAIMFFASYVIACSLNPAVTKLEKKMKRNFAAAVVLLAFLLILLAIVVPIVMLVGNEIKAFSNSMPAYFTGLYKSIVASPFYGKLGAFQLDWQNLFTNVSSYTANIFNEIINLGINISSAFVYLIISIIIIYYFMADKKIINEAYLKMFPPKLRKRADEISNIISQKIGGYIIALLATISSVGIIMAIGLTLFGVNYGVLLALITAVLDIIPVVGPVVALIICLIATFESGLSAVLAVIGIFAVAQLVENNFVRPYMFGKFLDLHPLLIYLFLFITAKYMGAVGVVFAPAIAATVCVLIEELYMKNIE